MIAHIGHDKEIAGDEYRHRGKRRDERPLPKPDQEAGESDRKHHHAVVETPRTVAGSAPPPFGTGVHDHLTEKAEDQEKRERAIAFDEKRHAEQRKINERRIREQTVVGGKQHVPRMKGADVEAVGSVVSGDEPEDVGGEVGVVPDVADRGRPVGAHRG